jgi:hypothetical protein
MSPALCIALKIPIAAHVHCVLSFSHLSIMSLKKTIQDESQQYFSSQIRKPSTGSVFWEAGMWLQWAIPWCGVAMTTVHIHCWTITVYA